MPARSYYPVVPQKHEQVGFVLECPVCWVNKLANRHLQFNSFTAFAWHKGKKGHSDCSPITKFIPR